jgi:AcrR family transcriptional regulator
MSVVKSSPVRRRRTAEDARAEALAAARKLLLEKGPEAVTLKAVSGAVGVTHANLLHHFGSAGALQTELMAMMVRDLGDSMRELIDKVREGEGSPEALVDLTFEAFGAGGAGHLAAWLVLNRETDRLEPIGAVVRDMAVALDGPNYREAVDKPILLVTLLAFADAVIGPHLRAMLDLDDKATRNMAVRLTVDSLRQKTAKRS